MVLIINTSAFIVTSKGTKCSYPHKSYFEPEPSFQAKCKDPEPERLATGKEVELIPSEVDCPAAVHLQRRSPSLDDVYTQVKGGYA